MARVTPPEPQSASDYDDRTTAAVKSVLIEVGQILGAFKGKFAVIGGAVPWPIDVVVDFLMPRDAEIVKNIPPLINEFAVQRADGADLAFRFYQMVAITGSMPAGSTNRVEIAVCSIPALLAMKGHAVRGRYKQKDAYDIYYCIRNYPDGMTSLVEACRPLLVHPSAVNGYRFIAEKFDSVQSYGPTYVRKLVEQTSILGERSPAQWQQDAFGQVDAWLRALGIRP